MTEELERNNALQIAGIQAQFNALQSERRARLSEIEVENYERATRLVSDTKASIRQLLRRVTKSEEEVERLKGSLRRLNGKVANFGKPRRAKR